MSNKNIYCICHQHCAIPERPNRRRHPQNSRRAPQCDCFRILTLVKVLLIFCVRFGWFSTSPVWKSRAFANMSGTMTYSTLDPRRYAESDFSLLPSGDVWITSWSQQFMLSSTYWSVPRYVSPDVSSSVTLNPVASCRSLIGMPSDIRWIMGKFSIECFTNIFEKRLWTVVWMMCVFALGLMHLRGSMDAYWLKVG